MEKGYLALVLHAHLPYVRHPEGEKFIEQRWLYESMTESYIPLLQVFEGLVKDGVDFRITISLSPPLVAMLTDELLQERYYIHLNSLIELANTEVERTQADSAMHSLATFYVEKFTSIRDFYLRYEGNLLTAFRELENLGKLEIITSAATHAFLPLLQTRQSIRAQLATARDFHVQNFGRAPKGLWLPECGYCPELDPIIKELGFEYFFVDSHGVGNADPAPVFGLLSPVLTPNGVAAFPRDQESSRQVWSSSEGYPGDFDYREYYRDIGYDLDMEVIGPYIHPDGIRLNTGIKYFRITGKQEHKEPYNLQWARAKAAGHANHFLHSRQKQIDFAAQRIGRKPIIVSPYDAELFGHWWYEGPMWIDFLFRKLHFDNFAIKATTPGEYLQKYPDYQVTNLPSSSWGRGGCADVWLRGENDWIYPALHHAEERMVQLAERAEPNSLERRTLNQAARELMLAQSSDWAFIMDSKTMVDYAVKRTKYHINRFAKLDNMLQTGQIDEVYLVELEALDNIFPHLDYSVYKELREKRSPLSPGKRPRLLVLSWEFPPMTVGGLSRHVYDLTRFMAQGEWEVHVVTTECENAPVYEVLNGVHVHRVKVLKPCGPEFIDWVLQLNFAMIDKCEQLADSGIDFEVIHAHDWLVCYAAKALKHKLQLPLIATIHATEHGRNNGIHTDLQGQIHNLEWTLTYEAQKVIVCSRYMEQEVQAVFQLPPDKLVVIPNGIDPKLLEIQAPTTQSSYSLQHERVILFIGRMVREKGVHVLLEAAPRILREFPEVKFVFAGTGPALGELKALAAHMGISQKVLFPGFVSDDERNRLLRLAEIAVFPSLYEPFGIVALEGMAAGTPVVVSDIGGLADVVEHGRNGLKAYAGNVQSLADQLIELLQNPDWGKELARTALAGINTYNWEKIATQTTLVYDQLIDTTQTRRAMDQVAVGQDLLLSR